MGGISGGGTPLGQGQKITSSSLTVTHPTSDSTNLEQVGAAPQSLQLSLQTLSPVALTQTQLGTFYESTSTPGHWALELCASQGPYIPTPGGFAPQIHVSPNAGFGDPVTAMTVEVIMTCYKIGVADFIQVNGTLTITAPGSQVLLWDAAPIASSGTTFTYTGGGTSTAAPVTAAAGSQYAVDVNLSATYT